MKIFLQRAALLVAFSLSLQVADADENVVRAGLLQGFPLSFALGGVSNYVEGGDQVYFTTYDGKTTPPKTIKTDTGELRGSDEFVAGELAGYWRTDYFVTAEIGGKKKLVEYGTLNVNFGVSDSNGNNVPDIADATASFHAVGAGIKTVDFLAAGRTSAVPDDYMLQLDRDQNNLRGTWMFGNSTWAISGGYYETPHTQGSFNYYRGDTKNFLDLYFTFPFQYTAKTFYSIPDPDHISVKGMTFISEDLRPIRAAPFELMRNGRDYWGIAQFVDGNTTTPIKDYRSWMFVLRDSNDTDSDGTPNFSDYRTLRITKEPIGRTLKLGATYTLSAAYKPFGKDPIGTVEPQWLYNGSPIPGANQLRYTLRDFDSMDAGNYQLRLTSPAGAVFSSPAQLNY